METAFKKLKDGEGDSVVKGEVGRGKQRPDHARPLRSSGKV